MPNSNITSHVTVSVTLGAGGYADNVAVNFLASVIPAAAGAVGIYGAVADGFISNAGGTIIGGAAGGSVGAGAGVELKAGAIRNDGSIAGGAGGQGIGVSLSNAYLYNHRGVTISGGAGNSTNLAGDGVFAENSSIENFGVIVGGAAGTTSHSAVLINGASAVYLDGGTLRDFGTIIGGSPGVYNTFTGTQGDAVEFGINAATLILDGQATINGQVVANTAVADVLYLDNSTGTFTGLGTQFTGFQQVRIQDSGNWTIAGANTIDSAEQMLFAPDASLTMTGTLKNLGAIVGGAGSDGLDGSGGGSGVAAAYFVLNSGTVINEGSITGGAGGNSQDGVGSSGGSGGTGGVGIDISAGSSASNVGVLMSYAFDHYVVHGGAGGNGSDASDSGGTGGTGGVGVSLNSVMLTNSADIQGGLGGKGGDSAFSGGSGGIGGAGIVLTATTLSNSASITGGAGGTGGTTVGGGGGGGGDGGVGVLLKSGSLTNSGTLFGGDSGYGGNAGAALLMQAGNAVNTGLIFGGGGDFGGGAGGDGVRLTSGTLTNFGTIQGSAGALDLGTSTRGPSGDAIRFGNGVGTLVAMPGAAFVGLVVANPADADVLELGSTGSVGTLSGIGDNFSGFSTLQFDNGAHWSARGTPAALQPMDITGFQKSDSIDVTGIGVAKSALAIGHSVVLFSGTAETGTELFVFNTLTGVGGAALNAGTLTLAPDGSGGTTVSIACYCRGTRIATQAGETPIEALRIGDLVRTHERRRNAGRRTMASKVGEPRS